MAKPMRTFIAVELSESLESQLTTLQQTLSRSIPGVKWVSRDNLHVTLLFLGDVDPRDTVMICRTVQRVGSELAPFTLTVEGLGCFPNLRRPRVLWAGLTTGAETLQRLHAEIEPAMLDLRGYRREDRPYTPHVTLGRIDGEHDSEVIQNAISAKSTWHGGTCTINEILVMSSELTREGPIYTPIGRAPLTGTPTDD
ncbi:RNA 2',3'-cyclic phosphodiesterase [Tuwongella immobilis]|uniref:RNA 2',3'-cyclic phosphodiesterase n=1 Tax=Tuwongella immobilis TaxID=692036 RepID=A0A6C2YQS0_9BACT|nr:RNA 2',3'-cyclic phosphodiesterase [Tuwongella immobilis]VIP03681.1 2 -5 rna ligase : 2'-5' RNA ligase OS=Pirellula staleyi (strain ATCC 27377 / DSM 6068 / ICPB 4128) GN=Psta_3795 PE=4 SV=1: LigT_PEase: LigT_PEase [Tuwongella immobilis]VTS04730.1 2 -5 rna ligase : 2'-5' RNA ligase OS=Pirellula staleyi (strain ATCC 27377 / DSM 6068 / ICPB 4128) GN=Psta_3795 PE=4 SV=1: LigT_PEase: LigT_PEase [Tuwongella immobilis]